MFVLRFVVASAVDFFVCVLYLFLVWGVYMRL